MANKVIQFDLFMNERNHDTITIKNIFGRDITVRAEIPAIVPVMIARAENMKDANEQTRMIMRAADGFLGAATVDELCAKGMTAEQLVQLMFKLFAMINGADGDEEEELTDEDSRRSAGGSLEKK